MSAGGTRGPNAHSTLPQRGWFAQRIRALTDYERFGLPQKAGANYFYMRNSGLQNQSQLFVRKGLNGPARLLIDLLLDCSRPASALRRRSSAMRCRRSCCLTKRAGSWP